MRNFAIIVITTLLVGLFGLFLFAQTATAATGDCGSAVIVQNHEPTYVNTFTLSAASNQSVSVSFSSTTDFTICSVSYYGRRATYIADYFLEIASDRYTQSGRTVYANTTFSNSIFNLSNNWRTVTFPTPVDLQANTLYYFNTGWSSGHTSANVRWGYGTTPAYLPVWYSVDSLQSSVDPIFRISGTPFTAPPPTGSSTAFAAAAIINPMQAITGQTCVTDGATTTCTVIESPTTTAIQMTSGDLIFGLSLIIFVLIVAFIGFFIKTFTK